MTKKIVETNFVVFMYEVQQAVLDGYRLNTDFVPGFYGYHYEAELAKEQAVDKIVFTEEQQAKLEKAEVAGVVVPVVDGKVDEESVDKAVEVATTIPKRGRKPAGK